MRAFRRAVLKGKSNFDRLFGSGKRVHNRNISVIFLMVTPAEPSRIAVCLRRGVGTAPVRNRLRRITREAAEPFISALAAGRHIAFLPNRNFADLEPARRVEAVGALLKRARLLVESEARA